MFEELVGSGARREVQPLRGLVVAALHGVVIAGAVRATAEGSLRAAVPIDTTRFVIAADSPVEPVSGPVSADPLTGTRLPAELLLPPAELPSGLPPIVPGPGLDPELIRHVLGLGPPGGLPGDSIGTPRIRAAAEVDQPAVAIFQPKPRYPPVLQQAGVEGRVTVAFVIDTLGRTEPESFRVLDSGNAGFNAAALETVRQSRFRPARMNGGPVRQRTIQAVTFRIAPQ